MYGSTARNNVAGEQNGRALETGFFSRDSPSDSPMLEQSQHGSEISIWRSDRFMKFFICILYGICPGMLKTNERRICYLIPTILIVLLQWFAVFMYAYCINKFWSKIDGSLEYNGKDECINFIDVATGNIPSETAILLMGLVISGAITVSIGAVYFHRRGNVFARPSYVKFELLPQIQFRNENEDWEDDSKDWLSTNILVGIGLLVMAFAIFTDQQYNTFYDFIGIHDFLNKTKVTSTAPCRQTISVVNSSIVDASTPKKANLTEKFLYYTALAMLFWGFGATICACCLFHAMANRITARIKNTQEVILSRARSRDEFFLHIRKLHDYKDGMVSKFKLWFASHNVMFVILLAAMIYEWVIVFRDTGSTKKPDPCRTHCKNKLLMAQISGTLLICYKFAFPILSASKVTSCFQKFYMNIALSNKVQDLDVIELMALSKNSGFELYFIRVTPQLAVAIFISCFIGILKFVGDVDGGI
eukprot:Seg1643.6 transcript_id=Seg1643.6/GoldUCD/mRNA.D3Y31 product="hypothetical protein" protein_id=Seg1643.6/GoldUCD/D3Y31